ncbi:hypothetical protein [Saccharopolyspora mangrovi]|uniref:Uncharacterized protein n=1 Tax=Saccharopolyspora mangrovi TaxID=3082379 RepID=A0ABU6AFD5_9PSEU|nr:hypothetical protein [Saccharopolyspora sp. S2-29]MEB3370220.1 hypothetical protein [Saccharopolyspora sp. S2-29]
MRVKTRYYSGAFGAVTDLTPTAEGISMGITDQFAGRTEHARCLLDRDEFRRLLAEGEALLAESEARERKDYPPHPDED